MKTALLLYAGFVDFEISLLLMLLRDKSELLVISVDELAVTSYERLRVQANTRLREVDSYEFDLLIIPGGEPGAYEGRQDIREFLTQVNHRGIPIAAICGGPEFMAQAGLIVGKQITHGHEPEYAATVFSESIIEDADVVIDGNIITARGNAYAEFAVAVCDRLGLFANDSEKTDTLNWMKNLH